MDSESEGTDNVDGGISGQQNRARFSDVDEPWTQYKMDAQKNFSAELDQGQLQENQRLQQLLAESTKKNAELRAKWQALELWNCGNCRSGPFLGANTPTCLTCGHMRCDSCPTLDDV